MGVHILVMRFCLTLFLFSSVLQAFSFSSVLGWTNVNAKPKTEVNSSVFIQKRCNVNGALNWLSDFFKSMTISSAIEYYGKIDVKISCQDI